MNQDRAYGIEIELLHDDKIAMARALTAAGIDIQVSHYTHSTTSYWKMVDDASLRGGNGYELVSPKLYGENGLDQIRTVCRVLAEQGARVNVTCGLHVHHDAADYKAKHFENVLRLYGRAESVLDSMMPKSRRENNNTYCRSVDGIAGRIGYSRMGRYYKVNFESYQRHGTVEFRHHSGTIEADKIINWVLITQRIMDRCKKMVKAGHKLSMYDFQQIIGLIHDGADTIRQYIGTRVQALAA